jgi:uncharacterized membrane protein YhaH (DUF805 family)
MKLLLLLFSFFGRTNRAKYWLGLVIALGLSAVPWYIQIGILKFEPSGWNVALAYMSLLAVVSLVSLVVKRLHDLNLSGWWWLAGMALPVVVLKMADYHILPLGVVPLFLIAAYLPLIVLGAIKGTEGGNRFGPDPSKNTADEDLSPSRSEQGTTPLLQKDLQTPLIQEDTPLILRLTRYILIVASAAALIGILHSIAVDGPTEPKWANFAVPAALILNLVYLLFGVKAESLGANAKTPTRLFRLVSLWLDAKEAELRKRAAKTDR